MKIQVYIDRLFDGYENTPKIQDFKEEIAINLQERVAALEEKGLSPDEAFQKGVAELGDITGVAEQISKQKRNEVIGKMYFGSKPPISKAHAFGYVVAGGAIILSFLMSIITYISTGEISSEITTHLLTFFSLPIAVLVFLGLTQETTRNFPMVWTRALLYAIAIAFIFLGIGASARLYFTTGKEIQVILNSFLAFTIPGVLLLAYLLLTEKNRQKPWVLKEEEMMTKFYMQKYQNPADLGRRTALSGALWTFATAIFVVLGFIIGFQYSWVVYLFAIAAEIFIEFLVHPKDETSEEGKKGE